MFIGCNVGKRKKVHYDNCIYCQRSEQKNRVEYETLDAAINAAMTENSENIIYNIYGKNTIVRTNYFDVVGTGTTSVKFVGKEVVLCR